MKEAEFYIGRNVVKISVKMRPVVRIIKRIRIINVHLKKLETYKIGFYDRQVLLLDFRFNMGTACLFSSLSCWYGSAVLTYLVL